MITSQQINSDKNETSQTTWAIERRKHLAQYLAMLKPAAQPAILAGRIELNAQ
jgi:hypothetical protein